MNDFLTSFSPYFPWIVVLVLGLSFRKSIIRLIDALHRRIAGNSDISMKYGDAEIAITGSTQDARAAAAAHGGAVKTIGNPDQLKVLFKAKGPGWTKCTKALEVPGGCLVQMSTDRLRADNTVESSEALQFVPNTVLTLIDGPKPTYVLSASAI